MTKNPARRLGCTGNENQIRSHPFFKDLDWAALELRRVEPPFRPKVVRIFLTIIALHLSTHFIHITQCFQQVIEFSLEQLKLFIYLEPPK